MVSNSVLTQQFMCTQKKLFCAGFRCHGRCLGNTGKHIIVDSCPNRNPDDPNPGMGYHVRSCSQSLHLKRVTECLACNVEFLYVPTTNYIEVSNLHLQTFKKTFSGFLFQIHFHQQHLQIEQRKGLLYLKLLPPRLGLSTHSPWWGFKRCFLFVCNDHRKGEIHYYLLLF